MSYAETCFFAAFGDAAQIASLMYASRIPMLRAISTRTPPRSWKPTKRRKRGNTLSLVLSNVVSVAMMDIKDKTVAISGATRGKSDAFLNHLVITLSGADWLSKPEDAALSGISDAVYTWSNADEDASAQREAYMVHLKQMFCFCRPDMPSKTARRRALYLMSKA
jgi:hypothetical protein